MFSVYHPIGLQSNFLISTETPISWKQPMKEEVSLQGASKAAPKTAQ
jgi:hypothetical protein